ncbi:MAG: glycosyltransferase family 1 protein [Bacteroidaceae bacterium]|nr:glycosyltransferase family 1 protein [Bacteroidaceae bacterium]
MKILLLGEYSNVHWTLAEGLRRLGHEVTVVSDGDGWKDYRRDIDLRRRSQGRLHSLLYLKDVLTLWPRLRGYDVVQLINPVFLSFKAERIYSFYEKLRRQNRSLFMGAFGMDYYWVKAGMDGHTFRYSDFNLGSHLHHNADTEAWERDWLRGPKGELNRHIAADCDGIVSGLYEYDAAYRPYYAEKLQFIPFPVKPSGTVLRHVIAPHFVRFFIGIQRERSEYKGTDIMLAALQRVEREMSDHCLVSRAESVPYEQYRTLLDSSDVMLDQLYSYTPAMNALLGMSKGLVVVGGGEPENYEILGETRLRPIINVEPNEESVYQALKQLVEHRERIPELSKQSLEYIQKHHHFEKVAQRYVDFWQSRMH